MKKIISLIKKIIFAFVILYGLDVILASTNFYIPINIITITTVTLLQIPGLLMLIAMFFII